MAAPELEAVIQLLAKLPGLGPRSARRAVLALIKKREGLMQPLAAALAEAARRIQPCGLCGNLDSRDPCGLCADPGRDAGLICVVEEVADLWALEKSAVFRGRFHVLGGTLSAIAGRDPEALGIGRLLERARRPEVKEVILALSATVEGQTTAHYIAERLAGLEVLVTRPAHGLPVGGELEFLDEGTLVAAFRARQPAD